MVDGTMPRVDAWTVASFAFRRVGAALHLHSKEMR